MLKYKDSKLCSITDLFFWKRCSQRLAPFRIATGTIEACHSSKIYTSCSHQYYKSHNAYYCSFAVAIVVNFSA